MSQEGRASAKILGQQCAWWSEQLQRSQFWWHRAVEWREEEVKAERDSSCWKDPGLTKRSSLAIANIPHLFCGHWFVA